VARLFQVSEMTLMKTRIAFFKSFIPLMFAACLANAAEPVMKVHCINVGQADSTLLEFPCGAILIDAGAQDEAHLNGLLTYLGDWFLTRPDLNKTLEAIFITHNHIDHTRALRETAERFRVKRYFDNGQLQGKGTEDPRWIRTQNSIRVREIRVSDVPQPSVGHFGLTDADVDPLKCPDCDPRIVVLSGQHTDDPDWSEEELDNKNNHSLVIRVDFGEASFLFTGDLEEPGIEELLALYQNTSALDVDMYHVGHHGSHNATSEELLEALTPELAVISMGVWDFGKDSRNRFTTFAYGHPRRTTVDLLSRKMQTRRSRAIRVNVGDKARQFSSFDVRKNIYATGWDGTVVITAGLDGKRRMRRVDPPAIILEGEPVRFHHVVQPGATRLRERSRGGGI
jgi:competence protein ComEC